MGTFTSGIITFIVGTGLAVATAVGIVQAQQNAGAEPLQVTEVQYGR